MSYPLRKIVRVEREEYKEPSGIKITRFFEVLECGHRLRIKQDIHGETNAYKRRCKECAAPSPTPLRKDTYKMSELDDARRVLLHYFDQANPGIAKHPDHAREIQEIVDNIVNAAVKAALAAVEESKTPCDLDECTFHTHYELWYDPEVNGPKLSHVAYHAAEEQCRIAQERILEWMNTNAGDPLDDPAGRRLWNEANRWELRIAV